MPERKRHTEEHDREPAPRPGEGEGHDFAEGDGLGPEGEVQDRGHSTGYKVLRVLAIAAGVIVFLLIVTYAVLQTPWGHRQAKKYVLTRVNTLFDGAELKAGDLTGSLLGNFTLVNVHLVTEEGDTLAYIDSLHANYNLWYLLQDRLVLHNINMYEPWVAMHQLEDGSWDLLNVIAHDDSVSVDTVETYWTKLVIQFDQTDIVNGRVDAAFYAPGRDSILNVRGLRVDLGNSSLGDSLTLDVNELAARFSPPGQSYWASTELRGRIEGSYIQVGRLAVTSPRSVVRANGSLRLPTDTTSTYRDVNFRFTARPVAFADIDPFIPGLKAQGTADVDLTLKGTGRNLKVDAEAAFSDGGTFKVNGTVSPNRNGPVAYVLSVRARRLDPQTLLGNGVQAGRVNANLDVDLRGTKPEQVSGTLGAEVFETTYGEYTLGRTTLTSRWNAGQARFDLNTALRGARFAVNGTARPFDDVPTYDVTGRVEGLDVGKFAEDSEVETAIAGRFNIAGQGFSSETAQLTGRVSLDPSTVNGYLIENAGLDVKLTGSNLDFGARVLVPEGRLMAQGTLDWGGDLLRYDVRRGRMENFDIAAFLGTGEDEGSSFTGNFTVSGRGTDPQELNAEFSLDLAQGHYGDVTIAGANAQGRLVDGTVTARAVVDLERAGYFNTTLTARPFAEDPSITFRQGEFRNVNVGVFTSDSEFTTDLSGTVVGTLRLTGTGTPVFEGRVDLDPSRINEQVINEAYLIADLDRRDLDFNLYVRAPEGQSHLSGVLRPFQPVPSYVIRDARFSNIDLAAITGNPSLKSDLTGTGSFSGRGLSLEDLTVQGQFMLSPSRINQQYINNASLTVNLQDESMAFNVRLDTPQGNTRLAGSADLGGNVPTYRIREGRFENINIGAFTGDENLQTNLTGTVMLQGRGLHPSTATASGRISLAASRINQQPIDAATLTGDLRNGRLTFNLNLDLPAGSTRLAGNAQLLSRPFTYEVTTGTFSGLNLGALMNNPHLDTDLNGQIARLHGRGVNPGEMDLSAQVRLDSSRINQQQINSATADLTLTNGRLAYDASLVVPEGETQLAGTAQPFLETPTYAVEQGSFQNLNVGALLGLDNLQTSLTGDVTLRGQGFDPETLFLEANLDLDPSQINSGEITTGNVHALLQNGLVNLHADLILPEGRAQVQGTVRPFRELPTYDLAGTLRNVSLDNFLGTDTLRAFLNGDFEVRGVGLNPRTMTARGSVRAAASRYQQVSVDSLLARFAIAEGVLNLDTLYLRSNVADATAGGTLALFDTTGVRRSDFTFSADIKDAEAIRPYLAPLGLELGQGQLQGRAYSENGTLRFDVEADLQRLAYQDYRVAGLQGHIVGELGPNNQLTVGEVRASFDFASIPGLSLQTSDIEISYNGDVAVFSGDIRIDPKRTVEVAGRVDLRPDQRAITLETLTLQFEDDTWQLLMPASITYGGQYRISNFLLYSGDQQIAIDGIIDPHGTQNLVATVENFNLATVTDLLGYEGLGGTVTGSLSMTGPASDPVAQGNLRLSLATQNEAVGDGRIGLQYEDRRLNVDALLTNPEGGRLSANGYLPINLSLAPGDSTMIVEGANVGQGVQLQAAEADGSSGVNLAIEADSFSVAWVQPFLDPNSYQDVQGTLVADMRVTGTMSTPVLEGDWRMIDGHVGLPAIGIGLDQINGQGRLENSVIHVARAVLRSGGGSMTATGTINLRQLTLGEFDINASLNDFRAANMPDFQNINVGGNVHLTGTTKLPVVTGNVEVLSADIYMENLISPNLAPIPVTQQDLDKLQAVFGYNVEAQDTSTFVLYDAVDLDLTLQLERDTWIRQRTTPQMAIQVAGRLDVRKPAYADMTNLFGTLDVVQGRSYVEEFGRQFDVTSGRITFRGDPTQFYLEAQAEYRVRNRQYAAAGESDVVITLNLEGRYGALETTLGSNIDMPMTDIVSYIATGRPAGQALQVGSIGTELAIGELASLVENAAAEELGLDVVQIRYDPIRGPQLVAGDYVSNDLFLGVSQSFGGIQQGTIGESGQTATEVTLEYEIYDWLLLQMVGGQSAGQQTLRFNLQWEQAY
ncbi:MAG TPA: translocation/assembly module TamB domain-containing protein [Rhodothermales bacterium]|nr:translocation/assembly module TamB domain-containing protein [Rhodothermales bacterium]